MHEYERGEQERFRLGEVVWCELDEPIVDPVDPERKILSWPAVVQDPSIDFTLALTNGDDGDRTQPAGGVGAEPARGIASRAGRVGGRKDLVSNQLFGYNGKGQGTASSLTPYLAGFIPSRLTECDMGTPADHPWVYEPDTWPTINLAPAAAPAEPDSSRHWSRSDTQSQRRPCCAACTVFPMPSPRRNAEGCCATWRRAMQAATAKGCRKGPLLPGLYFGTERIWVGDVVRLKLSANDVQKLQRELNSALVADKLPVRRIQGDRAG